MAKMMMYDDRHGVEARKYFQLLQLLRIMPLWMKETKLDLEKLRTRYYHGISDFESIQLKRNIPRSQRAMAQSAEIVRQNWENLLEDFGQFENKLQSRIDAKNDEIRGLQDGVCSQDPLKTMALTVKQHFNALNVETARKSTSMNRYIIVFTVVTIFYLPLGFVTVSYRRPQSGHGVAYLGTFRLLISRLVLLQYGSSA